MKVTKHHYLSKMKLIDQLVIEQKKQYRFMLIAIFLLLIPMGFLFINVHFFLILDDPIPFAIALCIPALISLATALKIETKINVLQKEIKNRD